ncbi:MAG: hypothetical protein QXE22_07195 [Candidatus Bathyarchaeia archaeon]
MRTRRKRKLLRYERLLVLAKPYLKKNDFGVAHTERVLSIALKNFPIPSGLEEVALASIILHDIGGSSVKDQYEKGPKIAKRLLRRLDYDEPPKKSAKSFEHTTITLGTPPKRLRFCMIWIN